MNLVPLFEEALEFQDYNGTVLSDGKVAVYYIGRTRLADIYEDVDGSVPAENPRILNNLGMGPVYVNPAFDYEMVVFDTYGSELFSVKKYLASKGEHSTANVVVTPSESIAVSAWTVGDVQVYMPYLTGQLGKVYTGIDPIVVNNVEDKISANHVPLGVQDPLYFVQDDEEGCIIGFSGETLPEGTMNESAFGYQDGQITSYNGSAFSAGLNYEAGNYISISGNTLSVTGLTPVPADTASTGLVASVSADITAMIPDTSDMATQTWVNEQGFLTAHQDISNKLDTSAFSAVSGDFLTAIPDNYATKDYVQSGLSSKLDSSSFSSVSSTFLTAHQSLEGYATEDWVTGQGYLTEHQSLNGLMSADLLEISDNKITGYNGTAFAGQGGGVTGDFTLVEGNGIQLTDDPTAQTTTISVSGDYATNTQLQTVSADITAMIPTALTGEYLDKASADTLYYPLNSNPNNYLTTAYTPEFAYHDTAISSIDNSAIYDSSAHARINTLANRISTLSSEKADTTALTAYQEITGMTAYQPAGDYLTTGDSANFYTTANESGYITGVGDTYLQNTDLTIVDGKISEISGVPLSAGDELPSGVMNTSALEYNAVNEISGYNGSAIAQYGAEKQWLVTDDTLLTLSNSAQFAIGVNLSAVAQLLGVDETVLFDSSAGSQCTANAKLVFSENPFNFNKIKIYGGREPASRLSVQCQEFLCDSNYTTIDFNTIVQGGANEILMYNSRGTLVNSGINWNSTGTICKTFKTSVTSTTTSPQSVIRVVGIGRKS